MNRHSYWNQPIDMAMVVEEWSFEKTSGVNIQHILKEHRGCENFILMVMLKLINVSIRDGNSCNGVSRQWWVLTCVTSMVILAKC